LGGGLDSESWGFSTGKKSGMKITIRRRQMGARHRSGEKVGKKTDKAAQKKGLEVIKGTRVLNKADWGKHSHHQVNWGNGEGGRRNSARKKKTKGLC